MRQMLRRTIPIMLCAALVAVAPVGAQQEKDDSTSTAGSVPSLLGMAAKFVVQQAEEDPTSVPDGWTCTGNCGRLGANGVVTTPPSGATSYLWVSTNQGVNGVALPGVGGTGTPTNGSRLRSPLYQGKAGDNFSFFFNYVTSDGAGFADYAWARLLGVDGSPQALLFTARTTPSGNSVPGFGMPTPSATLTPGVVSIIDGGPVWTPLGPSSGECFDEGCGFTGWIRSQFVLPNDGQFQLEFGATNWTDEEFDTGMAVDGLALNDIALPVDPNNPPPITAVPEPSTVLLVAAGMASILLMGRRRRAA